MSDIVSARRLRKSVLKNIDQNSSTLYGDIRGDFSKHLGRIPMDTNLNSFSSADMLEGSSEKRISKFKIKILLKVFFSLLIVFCCLVGKLGLKEQLLSNLYVNALIAEYQKDFSKEEILEKIETFSENVYHTIKYLLPENLVNQIKDKYVVMVKPKILEFNLKEEVVSVFSNSSDVKEPVANQKNEKKIDSENINNKKEEILDGKGGGGPIIAEGSVMEEASAVSLMQDDIGMIVSKNIDMKKPISGTITSKYGTRDQIFENVNSYHTGLDIAAKSGTEIKSATTGKVIKVVENDKYYGNYVVIETNGVQFKYAHMKEIKTTLNTKINQDDIVGLVGSTGMSTGPHLHFEISINSRTIDPQSLIQF